jgi:beta-galactosidase beta subunit
MYPQLIELIEFIKLNELIAVNQKLEFKNLTIIPISSDGVSDSFDINLLEAHKNLMDIHITLSGEDIMAYADLVTESEICKEYVEKDDYLLAKSDKIKTLRIPESYFCLVPNNFAHMALYKGHLNLKKIVVKLRV